jgi:hypothetical protein
MKLNVWQVIIIALIVWGATVAYYRNKPDAQYTFNGSEQNGQSSKSENLDLQEKCAKQAQAQFKLDGWDKKSGGAFFSNHYNEKLNKCFMMIENAGEESSLHDGTFIDTKILLDAFEGKPYAEYIWHSDKGKKYWEVPPQLCHVWLLNGEKKTCNSSDEFDELVGDYMSYSDRK